MPQLYKEDPVTRASFMVGSPSPGYWTNLLLDEALISFD